MRVEVFFVDDQVGWLGKVRLLSCPRRGQKVQVEDHGPLQAGRVELQVIVAQRRLARTDKKSCTGIVGAIGLTWEMLLNLSQGYTFFA